MAYSRMMSEMEGTKTQLAVLIVIVLLSLDEVNPIKLLISVTSAHLPYLTSLHIATLAIALISYIFFTDFRQILYFGVKVFFHSILSIFFTNIEIIGLDNIPSVGPCIFVGNHANQFIDGLMLMTTMPPNRSLSLLVAEKSWNRRIIGDLAWAMGGVPVKRAQDKVKKGVGYMTITKIESSKDVQPEVEPGQDKLPVGLELTFDCDVEIDTQVRVGDKLSFSGNAEQYKILSFTSTTATVEAPGPSTSLPSYFKLPPAKNTQSLKFDIFERVDQSEVYSKVIQLLSTGGSIGIFPEGGSHDRTDLLPLKVGVALIAYAALEARGICIPIVPVGLNYFRAHRFRGRAVVEYGQPIYLNPKSLKDYKSGGNLKKNVCNDLMARIGEGMRSVIVTTPDYSTLKNVYCARRLWKRDVDISIQEKQDLNRRFALGMQHMLIKWNNNPPPDLTLFMDKMQVYQKELETLGVRDYQVPTLESNDAAALAGLGGVDDRRSFTVRLAQFFESNGLTDLRVPYRIAHMVLTLTLAFIPAIMLNLPVGIISNFYAENKRKLALKGSKVKINAFDVLLSEKVMLCIVLVPLLWLFYLGIMVFCTNMDKGLIVLVIFSLPVFSYMGIMATEAGMVDLKDLRPHIMKLFPSTRKRMRQLPGLRLNLVQEMKSMIRKHGPELGDIYFKKEVDFRRIHMEQAKEKEQAKVRSESAGKEELLEKSKVN